MTVLLLSFVLLILMTRHVFREMSYDLRVHLLEIVDGHGAAGLAGGWPCALRLSSLTATSRNQTTGCVDDLALFMTRVGRPWSRLRSGAAISTPPSASKVVKKRRRTATNSMEGWKWPENQSEKAGAITE